MKKLSLKLSEGCKGSQSAKRLAQGLSSAVGYKVFRTTKDKPKKRQLHYGQGVDKIKQYAFFQDSGIPALEFTTELPTARQWLVDGNTVIARHLISSSCGKGIKIFDPNQPLDEDDNDALILFDDDDVPPVWTKYKKKKREFRVHVFQDKVVRVVEKKLRKDWNGPRESKIRNLANGYVFCACENEPDGLRDLALGAANVVASDFKGVDIGFNEKKNELFVIEVNSAPGAEGSTLAAYINAILEK